MKPPDWLLHELQLKGVLFLNHVLQASVEALPRTRRLAGRTVQLRWHSHANSKQERQRTMSHEVFSPSGIHDGRDSSDIRISTLGSKT